MLEILESRGDLFSILNLFRLMGLEFVQFAGQLPFPPQRGFRNILARTTPHYETLPDQTFEEFNFRALHTSQINQQTENSARKILRSAYEFA